jgi:predicted Fe-Mo cluster-binding NifX family protein
LSSGVAHNQIGEELIGLLRQLGIAYQLMSDYKCQEAIKQFKKLPKKQQQTGWV